MPKLAISSKPALFKTLIISLSIPTIEKSKGVSPKTLILIFSGLTEGLSCFLTIFWARAAKAIDAP